MIFRKKGRMIDVRALQRRRVVTIPKEEIKIPQTSEGFVDFANPSKEATPKETSSPDLLNFMGQESPTQEKFSTEEQGYNKREVDEKITTLDNQIYKLEQRIELLEKKAGVANSSGTGLIGW